MPPDIGEDPFADIDPQKAAVLNSASAEADAAHGPDPFAALPEIAETKTSITGSLVGHAARGALPAFGGMVAAGSGAEAGAAIGGLAGPVGAGIGGVAGGIGGFIAGSWATDEAQDVALHAMPNDWQDALGQSERIRGLQERQHPISSFIGGIAPYALTMSPGALTSKAASLPENATTFQRLMANPLTSRLFGGVAMGGMELGQEAWNDETPNWAKIGISTGFGLVFNKPTRFGEYLSETGAEAVRPALAPVRGAAFGAEMNRAPLEFPQGRARAPTEAAPPYYTTVEPSWPLLDIPTEGLLTPGEPTVSMAADLGVMGPGITEGTFLGGEEVNPALRAAAGNNAAAEQAAIGPLPGTDLNTLARKIDPEAFDERDRLTRQAQSLQEWITEQSNPTQATFDDLDTRQFALEAALRAANPNSPTAANFRASLTDLATERTEMQRRQDAWASGQHVETPDIALARQHLVSTLNDLSDLGERLSSARRKAAEYADQEPHPEPEPVSEPAPAPEPTGTPMTISPDLTAALGAPAPVKSTAEQVAFITQDRAAQLISAGMSPDVAHASAAVEAHFYTTLADRMGGRLGTAEDLYRARSAEVLTEEPAAPVEKEAALAQDALGSIRVRPGDVRSIIRLARDSNPSTFMHESMHDWLKQLLQDSLRPEATDQLKADAAAIRKYFNRPDDWTGFLKNGKDADVRPHERMARMFEQYLREGTAPSPELAGVFARFKTWLTAIYNVVKGTRVQGLGAPISEDIRQVFDRMLAKEPQRTTFAPESHPQPGIATIHRADAAETEPRSAEAVGDRVTSERLRVEAEPPPEIAHEIAAAQTAAADSGGEAGGGASGRGEVGDAGGASDAVAPGGGVEQGPRDVGAGGGEAVSEGTRLSEGAGTAGGGRTGPEPAATSGPEQLAPGAAPRFADTEPKLVDRAGNIRVENLTDQESIAQAIHESADRNDNFSGVRGGMTKGQISDLADSLELDPHNINQTTLSALLGGAENLGARILAARRLVIQSADIVSDLMKVAAESGSDHDLAAMAVAIARHDMIQSALSGITAEWGRAGNAFHTLLDGWEKAADVNQLLKDTLGRDLFQMKMLAKLGKNLDSPGKISKFLRDAQKRSFGGMILEYWINGLISGISTHVTYVIGNETLAAMKAGPETAAAWAIGAFRAQSGRAGTRVQLGEVGAQFGAAFRELPMAAQAALEAWRSGATTLLPEETARPYTAFQGDTSPTFSRNMTNDPVTWAQVQADASAILQGMRDGMVAGGQLLGSGGVAGAPTMGFQYSPLGQIPDIAYKGVNVLPLGTIARLPSRNVAGIHSFFRAMNYSMEINRIAFRTAVEEGLVGNARDARVAYLRQNPTEEAMEQARKVSTDLTLMGQGSQWTQNLSKFIGTKIKLPGLGEIAPLKFVDPFVHIAASIMDQSLIQRTPLGLLSSEIRADLMGKNGNVAQDTAMAKMLVGSAIAMTVGGLAAQGLVSGSGPSDPRQAAMWRLAGNQAHSVRIGDIWYDVHRLGPMGMLMGVAADMYDVAHKIGTEDAGVVGTSLLHAFAQNILDESFMRGPSDLIRAVTESNQYGPNYVRTFLSSFVPYSVGMSQLARASDPYSRQARSLMDVVLQHIPGQSESLYPKIDIWGQPMPNPDALVAAGVTAIYERRMSNDPVNIAMVNLGIGPGPVPRTIRNVKLTDEQYDTFATISGRAAKLRLDAFVNSPQFQNMPNWQRHDVIEEMIKQARETARGQMFKLFPDIPRAASQQKASKLTNDPRPIE